MSFVYLIEVRFSVLNISGKQQSFSFPLTVPGCACGWNLQVQASEVHGQPPVRTAPFPSTGSRLQELFTVKVNASNF